MVADLREMQENQWVSEIWIDKSEFIERITRAHFYAPFGVVHYARNLALPEGELSAQPTERGKHDHTKGQQSTGKRPAVTQ